MSRVLGRRELFIVCIIAFVALVVVPCLNVFVPEGHALHVSTFSLSLYGKYLTYAVLALGVNLLWGYTGILSLGQCLFFSLGGYALGMYLMLNIGRLGQYQKDIPDFMVFLEYETRYAATGGLPRHWIPFDSIWVAMLAVVLVPAIVAYIFGFLAFRSRIKGVYFSILSQALTYAACLMFFRNDFTFGGNNGLTDFKYLLGTPEFTASEIENPDRLLNELQSDSNPVAAAVWTRIPDKVQESLEGGGGSALSPAALADALTLAIYGPTLYEEQRFAGVTLSPETRSLLAGDSRSEFVLQTNRRLLEDAFPGGIERKRWIGFVVSSAPTRRALYIASALLLLLVYLFCRWLTSTKFGLIQRAIRDSENRVLFSGYATANFKLFVFVTAAVISGLGGALFVPQVGIINPSEMATERSLEAVVWVAVGGRGNLLGPILGAIGINALKSHATHAFAEQWPYILGSLFVLVTLFMPKGLVGVPAQLRDLGRCFLAKRAADLDPGKSPAPVTPLADDSANSK